MAITYGKHARDQMELREVSEQDVEAALRRQSRSPTPGEPGSIWIWGSQRGVGSSRCASEATTMSM
jgi:hypothetical protein